MNIKNKESVFALRKYKGDLHVHTKNDPDDVRKIPKERIGSNCADSTLEDTVKYYLDRMGCEYVAITNHSRDSSSKYMGGDYEKWLMWQGLSKNEARKIGEDTYRYGDKRLERVWIEIEKMKDGYEKGRILNGIEVNILHNGELDTKMIKDGKYDLVIASVHPWLFAQKPSVLEYQEMILQGIKNPVANIIAHIGYGCADYVEKMDWDFVARECICNHVAIEVNVAYLMRELEMGCCLDWKCGKTVEKIWKRVFELVPVLCDKVFEVLSKYFARGLKLALNSDLHNISARQQLMQNKNFGYWRILKVIEKYLNDFFVKHGVLSETIINNYRMDELHDFLKKKEGV